ncbi:MULTISPECIES: YybS family protein [Pontibacillus]|uniref:YybS family protein n=1 Tax=Pontibacillus chungwhensis TaxID=265426 RepID=A0ABY8UWR5_9BACI|nr:MULTISPECIES: YybS family protein [Pontibacillus]MCD5325632.1 YybS family protein [Pontibacillus sp. HN14]WIF98121.1 YybS family protein [Pontibacillus chungwhensis]
MKSSSMLRQSLLYGGVYIILILLTIVIPVLSIFSMVVLALPFFLFAAKNGWKQSLLFLVILSIVSMLILGTVAIPATFSVGIGGVFLGAALYNKKTPYEAWAQGTVGYLIGIVSFYLSMIVLFQLNLVEAFQDMIDEAFQSTESMVSDLGVSEEQLTIVQAQFENLPAMLPSIMAISAIVCSFITLWVGFRVRNKIEKETLKFPPVHQFSFPKSVLWYYFIAVVFTWIFQSPDEYMGVVAQNMYTLTGFFMILQGLSYLFALTHYKKRSKALPITAVILTLLFPYLLVFPVRILGIIDLGFSLRERLGKQ